MMVCVYFGCNKESQNAITNSYLRCCEINNKEQLFKRMNYYNVCLEQLYAVCITDGFSHDEAIAFVINHGNKITCALDDKNIT